jgi:hypothetical protein
MFDSSKLSRASCPGRIAYTILRDGILAYCTGTYFAITEYSEYSVLRVLWYSNNFLLLRGYCYYILGVHRSTQNNDNFIFVIITYYGVVQQQLLIVVVVNVLIVVVKKYKYY